ncbi:acyltransferase [Leptospira sp. 201903074]|uniref:acyltransferase family protein n=1 Tax=Leptospira abararensis TaxID=2810036 RepID=UPI001965A8E4|nr:acyltransferase [Leptospira abararensis]MBM9549004.1 acyltransferase [Leptospira abararensis]
MKKYFDHLTNLRPNETLSLHAMRGIGILFVLMVHFCHTLAKEAFNVNPELFGFFTNFTSVLDAFFVLSGYLISDQLFSAHKKGKDMSFKKFFRNRVLRIFPGYYFFITTIIILTFLQILLIDNVIQKKGITDVAVLSDFASLKARFSSSWADFVFVGNYIKGIHDHTWSLSVEEQFYLFIPFFMTFVLFKHPKHTMTFLGILYFIAILFRIFYFYSDAVIIKSEKMYYSTETRYDAFIVGIMIAYWGQYKQDFLKSKLFNSSVALSIFAVLLSINHLIPRNDSFLSVTFKYNVINIGYGFLLIFCLHTKERAYDTKLGSIYKSTIVFLARTSYTVYLWHLTISSILGNSGLITKPENIHPGVYYVTYFLIYCIISFLVGFVLYRFIEYPFILKKEQLKKV